MIQALRLQIGLECSADVNWVLRMFSNSAMDLEIIMCNHSDMNRSKTPEYDIKDASTRHHCYGMVWITLETGLWR